MSVIPGGMTESVARKVGCIDPRKSNALRSAEEEFMMRNKLISLLVLVSILFSVSMGAMAQEGETDAAAAEHPVINDGNPITLTINAAALLPSLNDVPTAEEPDVFKSMQTLADEFMKIHPNVTIEWDRSAPASSNEDALWEYITTQVASGSAPIISGAFSGAAHMADRDLVFDLTEALETPNTYVEGSPVWKSLFPDYMWTTNVVRSAKGQLLSLPVMTYTGPATAYYYNKDIFEEVGVEVPQTWEELFTVTQKINEAGYIGFGVVSNVNIDTRTWDNQFSLGVPYALNIKDKVDYNGDGDLAAEEMIRGIKEGYFSPTKHEYAREIYQQMLRKFTEMYPEGYETTDFESLWNEGKVGIIEALTARLPSENSNTERDFEFGLFPAPVITSDTSEYVAEIEYTEVGPYRPAPAVFYSILKPAVELAGDGAFDAAVEFLKFITAPDNLSMMVLEKKGAYLGAVKGCAVPPELNDWFNNSFPILPNFQWNVGDYLSTESRERANALMEMWYKGMVTDEEFYEQFEAEVQKGTDEYIEAMGIDTTGWNIPEE